MVKPDRYPLCSVLFKFWLPVDTIVTVLVTMPYSQLAFHGGNETVQLKPSNKHHRYFNINIFNVCQCRSFRGHGIFSILIRPASGTGQSIVCSLYVFPALQFILVNIFDVSVSHGVSPIHW